jgi:hypothetical protein
MKKIVLFISCCLLIFTSCEIDNYEGPNASIHGSFLDAKTGELVGTDIQECGLTVVEQGFANPSNQNWRIQNTGEYRNDMIFAATYNIRFENGNCYSFEEKDVVLKKGNNTKNFEVTPYIRVVNPSITKNGNKIIATFSLEGGKSEVELSSIRLFAFSDMWVANSIKFDLNSGTDMEVFDPAIAINPSTTYTLTIDLDQDRNSFKYTGKNYYFRIGALASLPNVGTIRHNYSPLVTIPF